MTYDQWKTTPPWDVYSKYDDDEYAEWEAYEAGWDAIPINIYGEPDAQEKAMGPRENPLHPMFRYHNCGTCRNGELPCKQGAPNRCEYPHARND